MDANDLFTAYYTQYRAEAEVPASTDDEYTIFLRLANEAIQRWANYDNTYWQECWNTLQNADDGDKSVVANQTAYACPSDMKQVGGFIKVLDSSNNIIRRIKLVDPQEAQFMAQDAEYCYVTGNINDGFFININPTPDATITGQIMDYDYYQLANTFSTGTDTTQMRNPYFIVHRALAARFRASRNPYYTAALRDSEDALGIMKMENDSGSWANPWKVADNSGSAWGR